MHIAAHTAIHLTRRATTQALLVTCAAACLWACSEDPEPDVHAATTADDATLDSTVDATGDDSGVVVDATIEDAAADAPVLPDVATGVTSDILTTGDTSVVDDAIGQPDAATALGDAIDDVEPQADGEGEGSLADIPPSGDASPSDTVAPPTLPLPGCAPNCLVCHQCPKKPICVDGKDYPSDCHAICDLKALTWPGTHVVEAGECFKSSCPKCTKQDVKAPHCATIKGGSQVPLAMACEAKCLQLDPSVAPNPAPGPCLTPCTKPIGQGGAGCPPGEPNPVCSKTDGQSYASECAMQHCDIKGCFPLGAPGKTSTCAPFKMTSACAGECYSKAKWPNCTDACEPVCRFDAKGYGVSYRNACIAKAEGAAVGSCAGISASKYDKCSIELYDKQGVGCCPGLDYTAIKQICASTGSGKDEVFYTFRSLKEYACLTKGQSLQWKFQFQGPCLCNCTKISKPVCGADGKTYQNLCQAKCHGGPGFKTTPGPCGGG